MTLDSGKYQVKPLPFDYEDQDNDSHLALLYEVGKKVGSTSRVTHMLEQVVQMTQHTLKASASSVLLFDEKEKELVFEVVGGSAGKSLRQVRLNPKAGIAGWVARNGKPLIVNDVHKDKRFDSTMDDTTGFVTKSMICVPMMIHRKVIGVLEVLNKLDGSDFTDQDLGAVISVASTSAMAIENTRLQQTILDAYNSTIKTLAAAIDAKDPYTRGHSQRVREYAILAGRFLPLSEEELEVLEHAAILHDVGKIAVDDHILNKPGPLAPDEWVVIREHPVIGANMIRDIPFLEKASNCILHHHEWYNGKGYPGKLEGENIPIGARIIAVADAFDTMTTDRSYRHAISEELAISEIFG
ncbi:HD domain-containing phosphohydrolase, partial [Chloroflexota bacterium]